MQDFAKYGIEYINVKKNAKALSFDEILAKIARRDTGKAGSCASQVLAYFGNKLGFDVTDYRGGASRSYFSRVSKYVDLLKEAGATVRGDGAYSVGTLSFWKSLRGSMEEGKEYILLAGRSSSSSSAGHAAVVKVEDGAYYYLELQNEPWWDGWQMFLDTDIKDRFGGTLRGSRRGYAFSYLVDMDGIDREELRKILGYLNTTE